MTDKEKCKMHGSTLKTNEYLIPGGNLRCLEKLFAKNRSRSLEYGDARYKCLKPTRFPAVLMSQIMSSFIVCSRVE